MTKPSSDEWLRRGHQSGERMCVVRSLVFYRIWTDGDGTPVGVTVDYEYADDVHIELELTSWVAFLDAVGLGGATEPTPRELEPVLFADDHSVFEDELLRLDLFADDHSVFEDEPLRLDLPYRKLTFR